MRRKGATFKLMKTAALPSGCIAPELRAQLEPVLAEGESLSSFFESSVRKAVEYRRLQADFHACGQTSWKDLQRRGVSHSVDAVLTKLRRMTTARRAQRKSR